MLGTGEEIHDECPERALAAVGYWSQAGKKQRFKYRTD